MLVASYAYFQISCMIIALVVKLVLITASAIIHACGKLLDKLYTIKFYYIYAYACVCADIIIMVRLVP